MVVTIRVLFCRSDLIIWGWIGTDEGGMRGGLKRGIGVVG